MKRITLYNIFAFDVHFRFVLKNGTTNCQEKYVNIWVIIMIELHIQKQVRIVTLTFQPQIWKLMQQIILCIKEILHKPAHLSKLLVEVLGIVKYRVHHFKLDNFRPKFVQKAKLSLSISIKVLNFPAPCQKPVIEHFERNVLPTGGDSARTQRMD